MALAFTHPLPIVQVGPVVGPIPTTSPFRARPTTCTQQPPQTPDSLRTAYKSAKAAYKSAKRAKLTTTSQQLTQLEVTYREAKARYKSSKYAPTPIYTQSSPPTTAPDATTQVVVCGGKSCKRLGADAVAAMLRVPPPTASCMNKCGGVGPTVRINSVPVKVNFRAALSEALRNAAETYSRN